MASKNKLNRLKVFIVNFRFVGEMRQIAIEKIVLGQNIDDAIKVARTKVFKDELSKKPSSSMDDLEFDTGLITTDVAFLAELDD